MRKQRHFWKSLFVAVLLVVMLPALEVKVDTVNGLGMAADGKWYCYTNEEVNYGYTGLCYDSQVGWWLVQNGQVAFD